MRSFGIGAAVGVMVDFVMSLVFVPTLLMLLKPETDVAPQERYLLAPMQRVAAILDPPRQAGRRWSRSR